VQALGFNWLRKLLVDINGEYKAIDYVVREGAQRVGKDEALAIHYEPRGCKGYKEAIGKRLLEEGFPIRICQCELEKSEAGARKERRLNDQHNDIRKALGAPPARQCQRFINGICLLNKKGKSCSSSRDIQGLWDMSPYSQKICVVQCALKPHPTMKGFCINGKECLYQHRPSKGAPHFPPRTLAHATSARAISYAEVFDSTLGFPGEGLLTVASYNINGTRGSLAAVLAQAKQAKIDILLLRELHFYENGEHPKVGYTAEKQGWT
jgi:hypothetical protein